MKPPHSLIICRVPCRLVSHPLRVCSGFQSATQGHVVVFERTFHVFFGKLGKFILLFSFPITESLNWSQFCAFHSILWVVLVLWQSAWIAILKSRCAWEPSYCDGRLRSERSKHCKKGAHTSCNICILKNMTIFSVTSALVQKLLLNKDICQGKTCLVFASVNYLSSALVKENLSYFPFTLPWAPEKRVKEKLDKENLLVCTVNKFSLTRGLVKENLLV